MINERIAFEGWLGIKPCGAAHDLAWAAWQARASLPAPQQATPEPVLRFCPGCGSVGDVPDTFRDCCPDGAKARPIPARLAHSCHDLFKLAIGAAQQSATPEPVGEVVAWLYAEDGETKFGHPNGYRPDDARPLVFGDTRPAPGVPEGFALARVIMAGEGRK